MGLSNSITERLENVAVRIPNALIPAPEVDLEKWAVLACDQHTSAPEYWDRVEQFVGAAPSTLRCILPEAYLESGDVDERIESAHRTMRRYLEDGTLRHAGEGFVLVRRTLSDETVRDGLMVALDLEQYDFRPDSRTPIRATESTIVERIPPRMRIRNGAPLEFPHILVLVDDPEETLIEPLIRRRESFRTLYSTSLMFDGGHVGGYLVAEESAVEQVTEALEALADPERFSERYGTKEVILFPVGDGNHSLAAARRYWEQVKEGGASADHPARFALVELVNLRGAGLPFHPIHRTVTGVDPQAAMTALESNGFRRQSTDADSADDASIVALHAPDNVAHFRSEDDKTLAVAQVDEVIAELNPGKVDYIHGAEAVRAATERGESVFVLPSLNRDQLLPTVLENGALPRKAFSLGRAEDKRYYLESRHLMSGGSGVQ